MAERVKGRYSLHAEEKPELCPNGHHHWRVVRCDEKWDTVECSQCGKQREAFCNFDDECK